MEYIIWFTILSNSLVLFSMYRNTWVFNVRAKILDEDYDEFKKLVSFNQMFWKVWIWDINKFKREIE